VLSSRRWRTRRAGEYQQDGGGTRSCEQEEKTARLGGDELPQTKFVVQAGRRVPPHTFETTITVFKKVNNEDK
jgi:hypothetical protein